ncbi:MAG: hypothetical protein EBR09_01395 [Proteobacteria bacterium]|nr:hypothetical protein [Pseudomonadota bacterium]
MTINDSTPNKTTASPVPASGFLSAVSGRLERELVALDSLGFKSQIWKTESNQASSIAAAVLDVNWLIAQPELPYLVQCLPAHLLYRSLTEHGIEDSLEVVEWIRGEALIRFMDHDIWTGAQAGGNLITDSDQPSGERFIQWIKWWNDISSEFAAQRAVEFDEGLLVGCMTAACEIIPVGLNRTQEELSDDYWITPDNRFGLKMKTADDGDFDVFHQFVHSLYKQDIKLAQSILAHSAMLVREECVEEARRWRTARLEEQGFVSADEARAMLNPKSNKQLTEIVRTAIRSEPLRYTMQALSAVSHPDSQGNVLLSDADEEIRDRITGFIRQQDSDELAAEIERVLGTGEIVRLIGTSAPQSDVLIQDDDVIDAFVSRLAGQTRQIISSLEAVKMRELRAAVRENSDAFLFDAAMAWLSESDLERIVDYKSRIARTTNAVAAALGVSGEPAELSRVLVAVHGCMNIGLERLIKDPRSFALEGHTGMENAASGLPEAAQAAAILKATGPEALFQTGWQTLQELSADTLQMLVYIVENNEQLREKVGTQYSVRLSDGEVAGLSVLHLQSRGRYPDVRNWLAQLETYFDASVHHILKSALNRLPVFPILLLEEGNVARGTTAVKPYERMEELEKSRVFVSRLAHVAVVSGQGE